MKLQEGNKFTFACTKFALTQMDKLQGNSMSQISISAIQRFPFKGFPGQAMKNTRLATGKGIQHDRRFAITNGITSNGEWMPPRSYYINSIKDGLLKFDLDISEDDQLLTLKNPDGDTITLDLEDTSNLADVNEAIPGFIASLGLPKEDEASPQIVEATGNLANWDYADTPISIINQASVEDLSRQLGIETLDWVRFRGNLLLTGLPAWEEFSWLGKRIQIGDAELEIFRPINRCPAPGVNPSTGERDVEVAPFLQEHYGHAYCGMYARVVKDGDIRQHSPVTIAGEATMDVEVARNERAPDYALWPRTARISRYDDNPSETVITLENTSPWPFPEAATGQRIRFHFGGIGWTQEYINEVSDNSLQFIVEDSPTQDPMTEYFRHKLIEGQDIVISGPFGRTG